jgi:hypothetical protein
MGRWPRIVRAMIGTGVTFAVGVGGVVAFVGSIVALFGKGSFHDVFELAGRLSLAGFVLGLAFSGILAVGARSRRFTELSVGRFASLGAGAGLLYFGVLAISAASHWSMADAIVNLLTLTFVGGGFAAGTLVLARKARAGLAPGAQSRFLGEG